MNLSIRQTVIVGSCCVIALLLGLGLYAWTAAGRLVADDDRRVLGMLWALAVSSVLVTGAFTIRNVRSAAARLLHGFRVTESGDLSFRLVERPVEDYGDVGRAFNRMVARLEAMSRDRGDAHAEVVRALDRARVFTEAAGLGTWYFHYRTGRLEVNDRYLEMLGETQESFGSSRDSFLSRLHPDDVAAFLSRTEAHVGGRTERVEGEIRLRHRDGSWRWISGLGQIVERDAAGHPLIMAGTQRDVTELRQAQAELDAQRRLLASLSANIPGVLHRLRVHPDGRRSFDYVGSNAVAVLGVPVEAFSAEAFRAVITPESLAAALPLIDAAIAAREGACYEVEIVLPDHRRRWIRCVSRPAGEDAGCALWDGVLFDVTDEVAQRRELLLARHEADAANRAKSSFLAGISHELRTPMTGVLGYASMIERLSDDARIRRMAATVTSSAQRLTTLLDDVLDAAKIEAGAMAVELTSARLGALVHEAAELFLPAIEGKGLALSIAVAPDADVPVDCDVQRVRQVLTNLLSNAVKFTERGAVEIRLRADPSTVRVQVRDTGPGIPAAFRSSVFERFRQADERVSKLHGGTGLGLALSRDFARLMGGDLLLCDPGPDAGPGGATFELVLRRKPRALAGRRDAPAEEAAAAV